MDLQMGPARPSSEWRTRVLFSLVTVTSGGDISATLRVRIEVDNVRWDGLVAWTAIASIFISVPPNVHHGFSDCLKDFE